MSNFKPAPRARRAAWLSFSGSARGQGLMELKRVFVKNLTGIQPLWQPQIEPAPASPTTHLGASQQAGLGDFHLLSQSCCAGRRCGCPGAGPIRGCYAAGAPVMGLTPNSSSEPTAGLSKEAEIEIFKLLKDLSSDVTIVAVTHSNIAKDFAGHTIELKHEPESVIPNACM